MPQEIWKPIRGYEGLYEVSNLGKVRSLGRTITGKRGSKHKVCTITYKYKELKQQVGRNGRPKVGLTQDQKQKWFYVHKLVAEKFLEPLPGKPLILHGPRGPLCNEVSNLRYGTYSENALDKHRDGTFPNAIGEYKAHMIREYRKHYGYTYGQLAKLFNCSAWTVENIVRRKSYRHLK